MSEVRREFDKCSFPTIEANYDSQGSLIEDKDGTAITKYKYDSVGHILEVAYFGVDGKLRASPLWGFAVERSRYDDRGNITEKTFLGESYRATTRKDLGISSMRWTHDNRGNVLEESHYDTTGILDEEKKTGIATVVHRYDNKGNLLEESYYGRDGKLKKDSTFGFAILRIRYDSNGNSVEESMYDANGASCESSEFGVAVIQYTYDEGGKGVVEQKSFGKDGELKNYAQGNYAVATVRYDKPSGQFKAFRYTVDEYVKLLLAELDNEGEDSKERVIHELEVAGTTQANSAINRYRLEMELVQMAKEYCVAMDTYDRLKYEFRYETARKDLKEKADEMRAFLRSTFVPKLRQLSRVAGRYAKVYGARPLYDLRTKYPIVRRALGF